MVEKNIQSFWVHPAVVLCVLVFVLSCTSFDPEPKPSRNLEIGEEVEVASQTIPSGGGTVVVNAPGSEIDGMEIDVPPGSYAASRTFKISTAPITSDKLGANFNPLTPLIQIENGGGYADSVMTVILPITLPEGEFPVGFFYNEISGSLEGLPLLSYTPTSVTVLTRHFMSESAIRSEWDDLKGEPLSLNTSVNMLIASVKESVLKGKPVISSGFNPGTDDWEFTNLGSYISPEGHCAGQSMAALWYYYEKKRNGEPALFHRFDLLNDKLKPSFMWEDNPLGYRFSSVIQKDFNFDGWINSLWMQSFIPELTFKTFAASILVTGEPQSVLIRNSQGQGGHAMIVYKVDYNGGILHIADPNYPNNQDFSTGVESIRTITFVNGSFQPYLIGLNAQSNSLIMDEIGYAGKTSYIPWGQIGKRYNEVLDSTIGNVAPNSFPGYRILIKSEKNSVLQNGHISETDTIRFIVECPTAERFYQINGMKLTGFDMYNEIGILDGKWDIPTSSNLRTLKPGLNKVGFYIYAYKYGLGDRGYFIDFKWFDIYYSQMKITPDPISGMPNDEITLTADFIGPLPTKTRYVWNFGDDTKEVSVKNDPKVKHTFAKEGVYEVRVSLYDDSNNSVIGFATAQAKIGETELSITITDTETGEYVSEDNLYTCTYYNLHFTLPQNLPENYEVHLIETTEAGTYDNIIRSSSDRNYYHSIFPGSQTFALQAIDQDNIVVSECVVVLNFNKKDFYNEMISKKTIYPNFDCGNGSCHYFEDERAFSYNVFDGKHNSPGAGTITWSGRTFTYHANNGFIDLSIEGILSQDCWSIETIKTKYSSAMMEYTIEASGLEVTYPVCSFYDSDVIGYELSPVQIQNNNVKATGRIKLSGDGDWINYINSDLSKSTYRVIFSN